MERLNKALLADSGAIVAGAVLGTSSTTAYVESAAGVQAGGRTGLTALVVAVLFLACLFIAPLAGVVPAYATAPALLFVACLMLRDLGDIDWGDTTESVPGRDHGAGDHPVHLFDRGRHRLRLHHLCRAEAADRAGHCEVVVFTQDPKASLAGLDLARIELLLRVWADRTARAQGLGGIQYVLPFENRGAEVGVTLHHPHGQIYSYPFVPPVPARMLSQEAAYYGQHQRSMLCDMVRDEIESGARLLYRGEHAVAFVPVCARYPYEVWVMPSAPCPSFTALSDAQRSDLARALKTVLLKFEGLWQRPFPYLMAWYQAPTDGKDHPETQLHAQFYPPYRTKERLKYLAGTELGAGMFAMDVLPEEKAAELQQVQVSLEGQ
jgi:UDPglucose--hexose-1-phosphate uridylyltransferase